MRHTLSIAVRAERRAAPKPARIPRDTKWTLLVPGDRAIYPSHEGHQ